MGSLLKYPGDIIPLIKMKMMIVKAEKQIPQQPHWAFCYTMLQKVARSFAFTISQLDVELRDAILIFYLVLRALDTIEDDTSVPSEVKVPILKEFHQHMYDPDWQFLCGVTDCKVLMEQFHNVRTAFLELKKSHQEAIKEVTQRMGAGMAKFINKEVETVDDLDEYAHYAAGLVGLGLSKIFYASRLEDMAPDSLSNSMGLFLQNANVIRDYLEDINEVPKSRMFWPRQIWGKYSNKLEDLKCAENSDKALQCLNEMVTNALPHASECLKYLAGLRDPNIFRFCAVPQVLAIGTLAMCYNNIEVFRSALKIRRGLTAQLINRTRTMSDVYCIFFEFSDMIKSKVETRDPNSVTTLSRLEAIQKICRDSGALDNRKLYYFSSDKGFSAARIVLISIILSVLLAYLSVKWQKTH